MSNCTNQKDFRVNNYQDVQSLYDQANAWVNNNDAQEAAKVITSSAFGTATTMAFIEYGVGEAVIGGAAAAAGVALSPVLMATAVVVGGVAAGYYAGKYYEYIFDELNRRGEIIGGVLYDQFHQPNGDVVPMTEAGFHNYLEALKKGYYDTGAACVSIDASNKYSAARAWAAPRFDPLILDLNGNGIETVVPNAANPILFDHNGDGIKTGTGWVASSDGFLVLDRNGNGTIDNGTELFGDSTAMAAGGTAANGFAALAGQDSNADGVVNALDANFASLKVWQDLNQDGVSQAGELKTLTELGIASLNIAKTVNSQTLAGGNQIADLGSFVRADGTTAVMADVNLAADAFHRSFTDVIPANEHGNDATLGYETRQARFPHPNPLPEGEGANESLREFYVNLQTAALPDMQGSDRVQDMNVTAANDAVFEMRSMG